MQPTKPSSSPMIAKIKSLSPIGEEQQFLAAEVEALAEYAAGPKRKKRLAKLICASFRGFPWVHKHEHPGDAVILDQDCDHQDRHSNSCKQEQMFDLRAA